MWPEGSRRGSRAVSLSREGSALRKSVGSRQG